VDPLFPDDELLSDLKPAVLPGAEKVVSSAAAGFAAASSPGAAAAMPFGTPGAAMERHTTSRAPAARSKAAARLASTWEPVSGLGAPSEKTLPAALLPRAETVAPPTPSYRIRVLTGPSAGREIAVAGDGVTVGRVGVQVARVAEQAGAWRLRRLEGAHPLALNGAEVPADGAALRAGDHFRVAGVELAFESS
jgi:hypothetical protein